MITLYRNTFRIRIPDKRYKQGYREERERIFTQYWLTFEDAEDSVERKVEFLKGRGFSKDDISYEIKGIDIKMDDRGVLRAIRGAVAATL